MRHNRRLPSLSNPQNFRRETLVKCPACACEPKVGPTRLANVEVKCLPAVHQFVTSGGLAYL